MRLIVTDEDNAGVEGAKGQVDRCTFPLKFCSFKLGIAAAVVKCLSVNIEP